MITRYILQFRSGGFEWTDVSVAPYTVGLNHVGYLGSPDGYAQAFQAFAASGEARETCVENGLPDVFWRVVRRDYTDTPV